MKEQKIVKTRKGEVILEDGRMVEFIPRQKPEVHFFSWVTPPRMSAFGLII